MPTTMNGKAKVTDIEPGAPADSEELARQEAIKQLERKRKFRVDTAVSGLIVVLVAVIWAFSEFHNAGGWPTHGFSQSSGIPHVWNNWISYVVIVWVFLTAAHAWSVYLRKPISEDEIERELKRQGRSRPAS